MLIIETDRLILRDLRQSDIPSLIDLWTDPAVTNFMGGPRNKKTLEEGISEDLSLPPVKIDNLWPVVEKATSKIIGHCGLLEKDIENKTEIELIYVFNEASWGNGYATEIGQGLLNHAVDELNLKRIVALIDPENRSSEKVVQKLGFIVEKKVKRPNGKNMILYKFEIM